MTSLLFKLRHVPEDEAEEVRALLEAHAIDYYETGAGTWKTSVPAIWLKDDDQLDLARGLLEQYQADRLIRVRGEYARLRQAGEHPTFLRNLREHPFRVTASLGLVLIVLYISIRLFSTLA